MSNQVKVSSIAQEVSSAPVTQLATDNVLTLSQSSNVALNLSPDAVQGYSKSGADLLIQLQSGETIRIVNFYAEGQAPSQLFLVEDDKLVAVSLPPVAADGALAAQYIPQQTLAGFESLTSGGEEGLTAGMAWLIGAGVVGGGAAIASGIGGGGGGGGNGSGGADVSAPGAATNLHVAPDGSSIGGNAEPGASVGIDIDGDGKPDVSVIAGPDGSFDLPLQPPLTNGETITVIVTDPAGNNSPPAHVDAPDTTAPAPATNLQVAPDGSSVSGKAEPGATVGVDSNGDGVPDRTVVVGADGTFTAPLVPPLTNGETISVIVTDPAGNSSPPAVIAAPDTTAPAPATNLQVAPDGSSVTGKAEPGATVGVDSNGDGVPDRTVVVGNDGTFTAPLVPPLTNGETVTVVVTDPAGNSSGPAQIAAPDTTAPAPASNLQVAPDGSSVSGNAEPGATVLLDYNGDGTADTSAVVAADGSFTVPLTPPLHDAETISVVVRDPAGNSSGPVTVLAPDFPSAPTVNPSNGSTVSGTAEAGVTVIVRDENGNPVGQGTADGTGHWTVTPAIAVGDGVTLNVHAEDANGNSSPSVSVVVDAIAPLAPVIDPSNGSILAGTAEAGASIVLTDSGGAVLGQVTVGGNGQWSFTPATPLADGVLVKVVASDAAGNHSPVSSVTVDALAPALPTVALSNGSELSGTAEPGSTVIITLAGGTAVGQVNAGPGGNWSFTPATALPDGSNVQVIARDAAGNESLPASVIIDAVAPPAPQVNASKGDTISGTAEDGAQIVLSDASGNALGTTSVVGGVWSYDFIPDLPHGAVVVVKAVDATGNASHTAAITVDAVAPNAPLLNPSNGQSISGSAEPGATISLSIGASAIGTAIVAQDGTWSFNPASQIPPISLPNGSVVVVTASDAAGNISLPSSVTVDSVAPGLPTVALSDGSVLTGTAEAGSTLLITDSNGDLIAEVLVGPGSTWTYTPVTPLDHGQQISVVARDEAGNRSNPASVTIDSLAPDVPHIDPSNGTLISGTAEEGAQVTLTDGNGDFIATVQAGAGGVWSYTPVPALPDGTVVVANATDATGNVSGNASIAVDGQYPGAPSINPSNGLTITGEAEPGATVLLSVAGSPIGEALVGPDGKWTFTGASQIPPVTLPHNTVVTALTRDPAGNTSPTSSVTIDAEAPLAPSINLSDGTTLSGSAEAGSTVLLTTGSGAVIGQAVANPSGEWSFSPSPALAHDTVVKAVARDAVGNTSLEGSVTIDSVAPNAPVIVPSDGKTISGTAENGAQITLSDANGNVLASGIAVVAGAWTYDLNPDQPHGAVVIAHATDPTGNVSGPAAVTVDAIAPDVPLFDPSNGLVISGTGEVGATISLSLNGSVIGETTVQGDGHWSFNPAAQLPPVTLAHDDEITLTAEDAAGNTSLPATLIIDAQAPAAPVVEPSNGSVLSGTVAEGNVLIEISVDGLVLDTVMTDASGNWQYVPAVPLSTGQVVTVTASDAAGNTSLPSAPVTVDADLPSTPVVNPSNGGLISGTADANVEVVLHDGSGNLLGQVTAGVDGSWSFTPLPALVDGVVVKVIAVNALLSESGQASIVIDAVPPLAPTVNLSNGVSLSGTAEAGATVIISDSVLGEVGRVTATAQGNWSLTPSSPLVHNSQVTVLARDAAGNNSVPANTVVDALPPGVPSIADSNGVSIRGTAEIGATVLIKTSTGTVVGQTVADGSGNWSFAPSPALSHGTEIRVTARDAAGNLSNEGSATIDAVAPATPLLNLSNGALISGSAEAGAKVLLTTAAGIVIGQTTAAGDGSWSFSPLPAVAHGLVINARAQDAAGNTSGPASTVVDSVAPTNPVVQLSNGSVLTGTAEAGAKLIITEAGTNQLITELTVPANGSWSYTPAVPLLHGTQVNVQAVDAVGNSSGLSSVTVDSQPPATPTVGLSNGSSLSGTAEAGSQVIITDGLGNAIGQTTATAGGTWSFAPASNLAHGTQVNVVARDATGNNSLAATVTIDSLPPAAPVINASNGQVLSGTAEVGAVVTLTGSGGIIIGQATAGAGGVWTYAPGTALSHGTTVTARAADATGNISAPAVTNVDAQAPDAPSIALSNGVTVRGTAEIGAKVILSSGGSQLAEVAVDGTGNWSYSPATPLAHGVLVTAQAVDAVGNSSTTASVVIDSVAPNAPLINPSMGAVISGTGEVGALIKVTDGNNVAIGQVTVGAGGTWSVTPAAPLAHATVVKATATDPTGNVSLPATISVDKVAPNAPVLTLNHDGNLLTGTAEANSQLRIVVNGDNANPLTVSVSASGTFSLPISPALVAGESIRGVAVDASGNISAPTTIYALDLAPPTLSVAEAADGYINAVEISNGIQVQVGLRPTMQAGQTLTLKFVGQNGYEQSLSHTLTTAEISAGNVNLTLTPQGGNGPFPQGAASITADVSGGTSSAPVSFVVDTVPPAAPVLNLVGNLLTVTSEPFTKVTVAVAVGGVVATVDVFTDSNGKALVNLLTDLDIQLGWDQLLTAQVSARAEDQAGNQGGIASVGVGPNVPQPITVGNFGLDVGLLPPKLGISGTTTPGTTVRVEVDTPLLDVTLLPTVNASGAFSINLLNLLSISDVLNLGSNLSILIVTQDSNGVDSSRYGIDLLPAGGGLLQLGTIHLYGTAANDVLAARTGSAEYIHGYDGHDLITNVGTGDRVDAGAGNDTIQITSLNFTHVDGGAGFDTLLLANGIDLDYNAIGVGTLANIERINLGKGDSGSDLTLTAAEVGIITDSNNTLQITGESNDKLKVAGAIDTHTSQVIGGVTYDVYSFGSNTLLVEDNTVQVVLV
jgi:hypothetical protein